MTRNQQWILLFLSLALTLFFFLTNPPLPIHRSAFRIDPEDSATYRLPTGDWKVEVDGNVNCRGVYDVEPGMTVADVIAKAGGMSSKLSLSPQSLLRKIEKSCRLNVVSGKEGKAQVQFESLSPKKIPILALRVNPNSANLEELDTLPGIGPKTAQAIIEWRKTHGPFLSAEDLSEVRGIGPKKLVAILPRITLENEYPKIPAE
jgi:competence protein ComEA